MWSPSPPSSPALIMTKCRTWGRTSSSAFRPRRSRPSAPRWFGSRRERSGRTSLRSIARPSKPRLPASPSDRSTVRARGRPRTKPAELRREELLDAAQRLFLDKGIGATSIDDIASAAEVAKGTFYLYFSSKEVLLHELQERFVAALSGTTRSGHGPLRSGSLAAATASVGQDHHRGLSGQRPGARCDLS